MCESLSLSIDKLYKEKILKNPVKYYQDYQELSGKMEKSRAIYKGKIIDYLYQPVFFDHQDISRFNSLTRQMHNIVRKCVKEYLENPEFRKYFGFSKIMEDLILADPGYENPVPVSRMDIFYDYSDNFKFCELNGDGSSAMNEANTLEHIFLKSEILKEINKDNPLSGNELFHSWVKEIDTIYREFGGKEIKPNVAIADFKGLGTSEEFLVFQEAFQDAGYNCIIADPRDFIYSKGKLRHKPDNLVIDLIYRRAVNQEVEKRILEVTDFIQAYKEKAVCVVGPFRSQIMHNKIFFEIITDKEKTPFLSREDRNFIKKHVPRTLKLSKQTKELIISQKDDWVLKPQDLYAARGVYIGIDFNADEWEVKVTEALKQSDYLVQKFCPPPKRESIVFENEKPKLETYNTTLGLYVYNGKFYGLYSRTARTTVIAGIAECISLPNIVVGNEMQN